jgi:predicted acylesterase/phospholipase RssA
MSLYVPTPRPRDRDKLGLALAGGGFRASLFHLGVLRRMAELDLLRYVEVLSTVSGGSIIGALYMLLLKRRLDRRKHLGRQEYLDIVEELHRTLVAGVRKNLRTRLLMNPLGILRVLLTQHSLGKRMARIYERYLYRKAVEELGPAAGWRRWWRPGRIRLRDLRFTPGGEKVQGGLEAYNRDAVAQRGSVIPNLILNATSMNSGAPFRFSSVEIGDPRLGFFRYDEIGVLRARKRLIQELGEDEVRAALRAAPPGPVSLQGIAYARRAVSLALWWRTRERPDGSPSPDGWERLFQHPGVPGRLAGAAFGPLRQAKLAAWYLREGLARTPPVDGGVPAERHLDRFWQVLRAIHEELGDGLRQAAETDPGLREQLLDFVLELYCLRSAEVMSPRIERDWDRLSLGDGVGASACFPPIFPPLVVLGIYDDLYVARLGLTDGGVYENLGVLTLLDEGCTHIIASDTGGVFNVQQRASAGLLGMLGRLPGLLQDNIGELQRTGLRERRRVSRGVEKGTGSSPEWQEVASLYQLRGLAFFHIQSPAPSGVQGLDLGLDREAVARLRTDLDAFGEVEVAALVNQGYDSADRYIRRFLRDSPFAQASEAWTEPEAPPLPMPREPARTRRILEAGQSRFFRSLRLGAPVSWVFTLASIGLLLGATWRIHFSVRGAIDALADWLKGFLGEQIPLVGDWVVNTTLPLGPAVLAATGLGIVAGLIWPRVVSLFRREYARLLRPVASAFKWGRAGSANLLWLLGGAPLWIALGLAAFAWVSFLFYHLPFLRKARVR